jgi:high-affinity nickel-transport protein
MSMETLPTHGPSLIAVVFLLGLRHGLDPDHLAASDGLTRFNAAERPRLARWSGLLFSAGHGAVVTAIAVAAATLAAGWRAPAWLEDAGAWISIAFLTLLGLANLTAVLRTPSGEVVRTVGLRGGLFARLLHSRPLGRLMHSRPLGPLMQAEHPMLVAAVGAAFALSFDTIGQALLFSIAGSSFAGWICAAALGLVFTAGMMVTDALNGLWVSRMLARSAAHRAIASRVMGGAIGAVALAIAATGALRYASPSGAPPDSWTMTLGIAVMATVAAAYGLGQMLNFRST